MSAAQPYRSLADQIKDISDPAPPQDLDPEGFGDAFERRAAADSDSDSDPDDGKHYDGREHYEAVGKSKLRQHDLPELGGRYTGARVKRSAMEEDDEDDDDDDDGSEVDGEDSEDDDADMADFTDEASSAEGGAFSASASDEDNSSATDEEEEEDDTGAVRAPKPVATVDRAQLRAVMAEERKAVVSAMTQAAQDDAAKGAAVKTQRQTNAALLRTRIQLQKALISSNSLAPALQSDTNEDSAQAALESAEAAALSLLNSISALQASLPSVSSAKRSHADAFTASTPSGTIAADLAATLKATQPRHRAVLDKWAHKTHAPAAAAAMASRPNRLGAAGAAAQREQQQNGYQPLSTVLDAQLNGSAHERHVLKTRAPRSCAPVQAGQGVKEDSNVFDDADWYAVLLQELIEVRAGGAEAGAVVGMQGAGIAEAAKLRRENRVHRRDVDTKASKGKKLRFTVHEKLQNFMAPRDLSTWGERKKDEFFSGLLGRKVQGGLREDEESSEDEAEGAEFRLF